MRTIDTYHYMLDLKALSFLFIQVKTHAFRSYIILSAKGWKTSLTNNLSDYLQHGTEGSLEDFGTLCRNFPHRNLLTGTR
ncbi:hypothetical protein ACROYT_G022122 [Oculina patagonica]